eukprot:TRINITY_DN31853_c0_g1_i2.p1 TRINITY_DN31853_c0_g1~~TRINITY_DN31853_c0_g1_i2.p1  ORF type:complete len:499 (+),score=124.99 TRINITY_DN31853_c0_g1_i2:100-1596(+)
MTSTPLLSPEWRAAHTAELDGGRIQLQFKEELRIELLRAIERRIAGAGGLRWVQEEVERFLHSGRISDSNLGRLERKVLTRLSGSQTSRTGSAYSCTANSEFSHPGSLTARQRTGQVGPLQASGATAVSGAASPKQGQPQTFTIPEDGLSKWSEVAKIAEVLARDKQAEEKEASNKRKKDMADYLQLQVELKKKQSELERKEERRLFTVQEAELNRWKQEQDALASAKHQRAMEVKKEREAQTAKNYTRREEERLKKLDEDQRLVQRINRELEAESQKMLAQKEEAKQRHLATARASLKGKYTEAEIRQMRVAEEQKMMRDLAEVQDKIEARNKHVAVKHQNMDWVQPKSKRRGEEIYYDEELVTKLYNESLARSTQAEQAKQERQKNERLANKEFLFKQMAERDTSRQEERAHKGNLKLAAQEATQAYLDQEKQKAEKQKDRYARYRQELEQQIMAKKLQDVLGEDEMSHAERAINKRILVEARQSKAKSLSAAEDE